MRISAYDKYIQNYDMNASAWQKNENRVPNIKKNPNQLWML